MLLGNWGGDGISLVADSRVTAVHFGCGEFRTEAPVPLGADGTFAVRTVPADPRVRLVVQLQGRARGRTLDVIVTVSQPVPESGIVGGFYETPYRLERERRPTLTRTTCFFSGDP